MRVDSKQRLAVLLGALGLALAIAGSAAAAGGGFEPVAPRSPNARAIADAYWLVFGFTAFIFVIVEVALVVFVFRFRSRAGAATSTDRRSAAIRTSSSRGPRDRC